jgi:hypothetical protein
VIVSHLPWSYCCFLLKPASASDALKVWRRITAASPTTTLPTPGTLRANDRETSES